MKKVLDKLYIIDGIGSANVFLVEEDDGFTLIDTGIFMQTDKLITRIEAGGFSISALKTILLTHCHCDHIGGAAVLVKQTGAKVAAHEGDIPYILQQAVIDGPYHGMMVEEQKYMRQFHCVVQAVDRKLRDGDVLDLLGGLQVIHVPGHTPGSVAFYQKEQRIMFFSDVIRNNEKNGLTVGIPEKFNIDTPQTHADAKKLLSYPIDYALFSHGAPILGNADKVLKTLAI